MTDYTPPANNDLPEANPEYCATLRRELDAVYDTGLAVLRAANRDAREQAERSLVATAQHAGADAAQLVKLAGGTVEAQADAYHQAYVKQASAAGLAPVCHCQNCGKA